MGNKDGLHNFKARKYMDETEIKILNWKEAAKAWLDGEILQAYNGQTEVWGESVDWSYQKYIMFAEGLKYRIKPKYTVGDETFDYHQAVKFFKEGVKLQICFDKKKEWVDFNEDRPIFREHDLFRIKPNEPPK